MPGTITNAATTKATATPQAKKTPTPAPKKTATPAPTKPPSTSTPKQIANPLANQIIQFIPKLIPTAAPAATPKYTLTTMTPLEKKTASPVQPSFRPVQIITPKPTATSSLYFTTIAPQKSPALTNTPVPKANPVQIITPKPTASSTVAPTLSPVMTPAPTLTPKPTLTPIPTPIFTVAPTLKPLEMSIQQIGDQFVDVFIQGNGSSYDLYIDRFYSKKISNGYHRISDMMPNAQTNIEIRDLKNNQSKSIDVRLKRQSYEERAFLHQLSKKDKNRLTYYVKETVPSAYHAYIDYSITEVFTSTGIQMIKTKTKEEALIHVDAFEPDFACSGYMQIMDIDDDNYPTQIDVVFNTVVYDRQPDFRNEKVSLHEFGHALGLAHQNEGKLTVDDNIEPSIMRQGYVDWRGFQNLDRYNLNWAYSPSKQTANIIRQSMHADVDHLNFQTLLSESDVVLIAKPKSSVSLPNQLVTETMLDVQTVLKGKAVQSIYEPYFIHNGMITTIESYQPMKNGQLYLLFLQKHKTKDTYKITGIQQGQFSFLQADGQGASYAYPTYPKLKNDALQWAQGVTK